jgi:pimeloyl-ACP methyl ester carboxylesterase
MGVLEPSGWCEVHGAQIAWQQYGNPQAQPVVCLHDLLSGSREFRPIQQSPLSGIRLILIDWPNHGRSSSAYSSSSQSSSSQSSPAQSSEAAPAIDTRHVSQFLASAFQDALEAVLNQLGLARPILLASGFGAAAAIRFASEHPARIRGMILIQPAGLFPPSGNPFRLSPSTTKPMSPAERQQARRVVLYRAGGPTLQKSLQAALGDLQHSQPGLRTALAGIRCPILFAFSRENRSYPLRKYLSLLDPLLKSSPQHRFTVFTGSFSPIWDEPTRFAQALTGFVQALLPLAEHTHAWLLTAVDYPTRDMNLWKCVHPECSAEQAHPVGHNPNHSPACESPT